MPPPNESARSFRWLSRHLRPDDSTSALHRSWRQARDEMRATSQKFGSLQDWVSDFWICKTAVVSDVGLGIQPGWDPPDTIDVWPSLPPLVEAHAPGDLRPTNHSYFSSLLSASADIEEDDSNAAVLAFYALDDATRQRADVAMVQAQHVRAWLTTALGNLLSSVALSPQAHHDELVHEARRRLLIPRRLDAAPIWGVQFAEGEIGLLYNCRQSPSGTLSWGGIRIGQGNEWLRHWQWLSAPVDAAHMLPAIGLAARLLRCRPLLAALSAALQSNDRGLEHIATAVVRRCLLALKAMSWLEDGLHRVWAQVRPLDLACFAFNAIKPDWPRRVVALSHRSMDAKPALMRTKAWRSSLFAIDANYAPAWETNTGMVWGLFAATPVLARIASPNYDASEWCQRESEMFAYLERTCDFMDRRFVFDADLEQVGRLDTFVDEVRPLSGMRSDHPEFPPMSQVYSPGTQAEWPLRMLRAAAALRVFHAFYASAAADAANRIMQLLCTTDALPPIPPPTNNVDGWAAYRQIFRDLQTECDIAGAVPLWFPRDVTPWPPDREQAFADAIPDLSRGQPSLPDVLAAIEWQATLLPVLEEASLGDMTIVDLRGVSKENWETEPRLSLSRGIAALRSPPRPVWFLQRAGQNVDRWGLPADRPIFTEYDDKQFAWMMVEGTLSPDWPATYAERCGLELSAELLAKCRQSA